LDIYSNLVLGLCYKQESLADISGKGIMLENKGSIDKCFEIDGLRSIRPMVDQPRVDPPHIAGRSAPSNLRGGRTDEWGGSTTEVYAVVPPHSIESTCWVDLWKKPRLSPWLQFYANNADSLPRPTTKPRRSLN